MTAHEEKTLSKLDERMTRAQNMPQWRQLHETIEAFRDFYKEAFEAGFRQAEGGGILKQLDEAG